MSLLSSSLLLCLLISVSLAQGQQQSVCVYTQDYWRQRPTLLPKRWLCATRWDELMQWEAPLLGDTRQETWLDAFHQTCAASCNLARLNQSRGPVAVQTAQLLDLLERGCSNLTAWSLRWRYNAPFNALLDAVRAFNRGQSTTGVPACGDEFSHAPFSFANRSDLFMVVLPSNETVATGSAYFSEALSNAFQIKNLFIAFIALSLALTALLALMYVMLARKRRFAYFCSEPADDSDAPAYLNVANSIVLSDSENEIDLSDLDPPKPGGGVGGTAASKQELL